jgi:hypothetical protein
MLWSFKVALNKKVGVGMLYYRHQKEAKGLQQSIRLWSVNTGIARISTAKHPPKARLEGTEVDNCIVVTHCGRF